MNKTLLSTALLSLLCSTTHADTTTIQATTPTAAPKALLGAPATPPATSPLTIKPIMATPTAAPTAAAPTAAGPVKPTDLATPASPQVIDCKYRLPAETSNIEETLVSTWAQKAASQSFDFNPATIDEELTTLKTCYTDQGWQGFNDALQKSGNISAIKSQHLTVSSQVDGEITINTVKDNQWKVTVPLQVVYQNDKEKLTQLLAVDLVIGRKISGDLGIMQMIATPRKDTGSQQAPTTTESVPAAGLTPTSQTPQKMQLKKPTLSTEQNPAPVNNNQPTTLQTHP